MAGCFALVYFHVPRTFWLHHLKELNMRRFPGILQNNGLFPVIGGAEIKVNRGFKTVECRKTNIITLANHKEHRHCSEAM